MSAKDTKVTLGGDGTDVLDIYIRMNGDAEKDYCFSVQKSAPVSQLMDIFEALPMTLAPSYFYDRYPVGFKLSKQAGFLTSQGAVLFTKTADSEEFLGKLESDKAISAQVWPGQLIVPIWQANNRRFLTVASVLLVWLYMDLPQHVTPTPGVSPTLLLMRAVDTIFRTSMQYPGGGEGMVWEWVFFAFHFIKVLVIWVFFYYGGINPLSMYPYSSKYSDNDKLTRETLVTIGWTGIRRITPREWREENRKYRIDAVGGIRAAHDAGILGGLPNAGVLLEHGEGFDTHLGNKQERTADGRLLFSAWYMDNLYEQITADLHRTDLTEERKKELLKSFRRTGPLDGSPVLLELYEARKASSKALE